MIIQSISLLIFGVSLLTALGTAVYFSAKWYYDAKRAKAAIV